MPNWQVHDHFVKWAMHNQEQAQEAIWALVGKGKSAEERVDGFLEKIPDEAVPGFGTRISITSYVLMGMDPKHNYMMYKPSVQLPKHKTT